MLLTIRKGPRGHQGDKFQEQGDVADAMPAEQKYTLQVIACSRDFPKIDNSGLQCIGSKICPTTETLACLYQTSLSACRKPWKQADSSQHIHAWPVRRLGGPEELRETP